MILQSNLLLHFYSYDEVLRNIETEVQGHDLLTVVINNALVCHHLSCLNRRILCICLFLSSGTKFLEMSRTSSTVNKSMV